MNQDQFRERFIAETPIFEAWGNCVTEEIKEKCAGQLSNADLKAFFKIPPAPRVKDVDSMIGKAFFRGKNYANPYEDITDKVGTRFVVLLLEDVRLISDAIEASELWTFSKDRDFEQERRNNPVTFEYQSVHYVVSSRQPLNFGDITVPAGTPCEVQVRTLLQHAYSELTHDRVYKSTVEAPPEVIRSLAKSMALIETTGSFFEEVANTLKDMNASINEFLNHLDELYFKMVGTRANREDRANTFILSAFNDQLPSTTSLDTFFEENAFIGAMIQTKAKASFLYRQPIVLLIYYMAQKYRNLTLSLWPLTADELRPVYTDLGISMRDS